MNKRRHWSIIIFVFAIATTFFATITGSFFTKKLSLEIGQVAKETSYAPFQVENEIATERKKVAAEKSVIPIYKADVQIQQKAVSDIETLFEYTQTIQTSDIAERLNKSPLEVLRSRSPIGLYREEYETLLGIPEEQLSYLKDLSIDIAAQLFKAGIQSQNVNKDVEIKTLLEASELSVTQQKLAQGIIAAVIKPNVILDEAATDDAKKLAREKVEPSYILPGEKIVEKGTLVTEETYKLLEKVGYLETNKSNKYKQYFGIILLIILLSAFVFKYSKQGANIKVYKHKEINLMLILYIVAILMVRLMKDLSFIYIPLGIVPMLIALLIGTNMAVIINIILVIIGSIIFKGDIVFILYFAIIGSLNTLVVGSLQERKKTMFGAVVVGGIQFVTYLALRLLIGTHIDITTFLEASIIFIGGVISVILVVGSLPLLESAFGYVTPMQLLELTNPNQPILKRLLLEATGTYYHSLLVANLAEAAADTIGANPLLARVGGYYHDIGKINCSNYFKENQGIDNPHDLMDPVKSAQILASHVTSGVQLVTEYHLPSYIKDMVTQHHGTSVMQYFYFKARKEKGDFIKEDQFRYKGPKPKTKEAALVMLADVVEATVRSMQDKLGVEVSVEEVVRKMVKQKLEEGQLDDCELYISDIDKIIQSFTKMLKGMYHERVTYPERNEK